MVLAVISAVVFVQVIEPLLLAVTLGTPTLGITSTMEVAVHPLDGSVTVSV